MCDMIKTDLGRGQPYLWPLHRVSFFFFKQTVSGGSSAIQ